MALKPDDLADAMVAALPAAWQKVKGEPFPGGSTEDARVMFLAVARGLLTYLENHEGDMVNTICMGIPGITGDTLNITRVDVNTDLS